MGNLSRLAVLIGAVVWGVCHAAPAIDGSSIRDTTLDNGLHVVVREAPWGGQVAMGLCIKVGPLYEGEKQQGLSDLVRYMILDAGAGQPQDLVAGGDTGGASSAKARRLGEYLDDLGVQLTAYTSPDATVISATMASSSLPRVLADLTHAVFYPRFTEEMWAEQVQVLSRRLTDMESAPKYRLFRLLAEAAFRVHPYRFPVPPRSDEVARYNSKDLSHFHRTFYVPNNTSLIVVGDVQFQAVQELAREHLGSIPSRPVNRPAVAIEPGQTEPRMSLTKAAVSSTFVAFGWHAAGIANKRDVCALDLIYALLGEGPEARLSRALGGRKDIVEAPQVEFITRRDPGLFIIFWACQPEAEYDTRAAVSAQVDRLRTSVISPEELATAKELIRAGYTFQNRTYADQVGSLAFYEAIDSYRFAVDYLDEVERVTAEDIQRVARQYLSAQTQTVAIVRPRSGGETREASILP